MFSVVHTSDVNQSPSSIYVPSSVQHFTTMERSVKFTGSVGFEAFISLKLETSHARWNCPLGELLGNFTSTHFQQESHYVGLSAEGSLVQGSASFGLSVDVYTCLDQQSAGGSRGKGDS